MKNVFLDLGTHFGEGLKEFIHKFHMNESWIIHTFEINSLTFENFIANQHKQYPWVIPHLEAASNHNGELKVFIESHPTRNGDTGEATSVIGLNEWNPFDGKWKQYFQKTSTVPCIDFSEFIINNFDKEDNIIVKMDIEGSEFDVLDRMIETGAIDYVNFISIEFHSHFFFEKDKMKERENKIMEVIKEKNITFEAWR